MRIETIYIDENNQEYDIWIGENQQDNEMIILKSDQNDIWFHLQNMSSPHIILKSHGDNIPKKYLNKIGILFRNYKKNLGNRYNVIYTLIKHVKLTNITGSVHTSNTKIIKY
jgi:predicted ribosome quality control (RQC) complex YloA/Tae2 family protein